MCRELAAARSPRAAVPGAGRHPSRGAAWQWETGARLRISFPLLETELRKHQARGGLRVPCRLDKPWRWIWQLGQGQRGPALGTGQIREGIETGCPSGRRGRCQPHAATCSEPALPSVWLSALSAAAPKAEGKEESRERKPN